MCQTASEAGIIAEKGIGRVTHQRKDIMQVSQLQEQLTGMWCYTKPAAGRSCHHHERAHGSGCCWGAQSPCLLHRRVRAELVAGPAASVQTWPLQESLNTRKTVAREGGALQ